MSAGMKALDYKKQLRQSQILRSNKSGTRYRPYCRSVENDVVVIRQCARDYEDSKSIVDDFRVPLSEEDVRATRPAAQWLLYDQGK